MTDKGRDLRDLAKSIATIAEEARKHREKRAAEEAQRRAALTPAERAAEDQRRTTLTKQLAAARLQEKFAAMGQGVLGRESWTIDKFAWLLAGENPDKRGGLLDLENDHAADARLAYRRALESCVGISLAPVNPTAPAAEQRFKVSDLIERAGALKLGSFAIMQSMFPGLPMGPVPRMPVTGPERSRLHRCHRSRTLTEMANGPAHRGTKYWTKYCARLSAGLSR